jgi:tRNA (guanine37-N1)-methyltransferase
LRKRLKTKLVATLPPREINKVYSSFDIIGDIAIIKHNQIQNPQAVANQILAIHRNIKTVLTPTTPIAGNFRTRKLKLLAGENKTKTRHRESGCVFEVDVEKCYFSPRLSHEHRRISELVTPDETVINMFAGVGCFSICIAKIQPKAKVYSVDINPYAFECMNQNVQENDVVSQVVCLEGDSKDIITGQLKAVADRVLMPLPEKAQEYLPYALMALKQEGGWIHYYDFQHAAKNESPIEKTQTIIAQKLDELGVEYQLHYSRIVRHTGPNWFQTVIDIHVT